MVRNLRHDDWVRQQFDKKYLKPTYRNVLIHSSIIEGTLRNKSRKKSFDSANKELRDTEKISESEFSIFDEIRDTRNRLVHDSFKNGLIQNKIDSLRDKLMRKILQAYRSSNFLNGTLFKKYRIDRVPSVEFVQAS